MAIRPPRATPTDAAGPRRRRGVPRGPRIVALLVAGTLVLAPGARAEDPPPGPAAEILRWSAHDLDRAPLDLQAGEIDLFLNAIQADAMQTLASDPGVDLILAPAQQLAILLNPAPAPEGKLNPFSITEVRQAVQSLVDRDLVAQEFLRGYGLPSISHLRAGSPDILTAYDLIRGSGIAFDPEDARARIAQAMTAAGATLVDGIWTYAGEPVEVIFIVRTEDVRRRIGDSVRAQLQKAGFVVDVRYQTYASAVEVVYGSDPAALGWHLYTESWGANGGSRWDPGASIQYVVPWYGDMPGWGQAGFWAWEDAEADDLGRRIYRGEFTSREERDELLRGLVRRDLEGSVRIWVATMLAGFPAAASVTGITEDVTAGPRGRVGLRAAAIPGRSELRIGVSSVWNESSTWNPVGGLNDIFSGVLSRNLTDPSVHADPWSGQVVPYRGRFQVETAGPDSRLPVPADAVTWDAQADAWIPVPAGAAARSKVTYDLSRFIGAPWHDGTAITLADLVYGMVQSREIAYDPVASAIEPAAASVRKPRLDTIVGYRFPTESTVEVYVDFWHFDEGEIAEYADPTSFVLPWQILAAMDTLVFRDRAAAYTSTTASQSRIPWLSLVLARDAALVDGELARMAESGSVPAGPFSIGGRELVSAEELAARVTASRDFFATTGHLHISSGPYRLTRFETTAQYAEMQAIRDPAYPMTAADVQPGPIPATTVGRPADRTLVMGEEAVLPIPVSGPGTPALRWVLVDPVTGLVIAQGEGAPGSDPGTLEVRIGAEVTADAFPGPYQLWVGVTNDLVARMTERRIDVEILP